MSDSQEITELLNVAAKVLLRCFLLGLLLVAVWFGILLLAPGLVHGAYDQLFHLTPHEIDVIHYCGIALVKAWVLLFFGFPYLSIRLVLRSRSA